MPLLFWLDVCCLTISAAIGSALLILVLVNGVKRQMNRCFILFTGFETAWAVTSLILRLSLWLERGNPGILASMASVMMGFLPIFLTLFIIHYSGKRTRIQDAIGISGLIVLAAAAYFVFTRSLITNPVLTEGGATTFDLAPGAFAVAAVPTVFFIWSIVLSSRRFYETGERFLLVATVTLFSGIVAGGLIELPIPVLSLTNTAGLAVLGVVITKKQTFNRLKELNDHLGRHIRERQQAEAELRESEQMFRNLADQSPNMIFINSMGRVVYANALCTEVMGYGHDEFCSPAFGFMQLIAPEDQELVRRNFERHLSGEDVPPYEYGLVTRTGTRIDAIITTKLISFRGSGAILGIVTDISSRKRTERFLSILNASSLDMLNASAADELYAAAGSALSKLGYTCTIFELDGDDVRCCFTTEEQSPKGDHGVLPETTVGGTGPLSSLPASIFRIIDKRETVFLEEDPVIIAPLVIDDEMLGFLAVRSGRLSESDIPQITAFSNQTAAAWRKYRLLENLKSSITELEQTQGRLLQSQKMEAVGKLAGGVAHDFNNLLTAITGYTDLLIEEVEEGTTMAADLSEIRRAADRAASLTRQLLAFSRKQVLKPVTLNLNDIIRGLEKMLRRLIGEDIDLSYFLDDSLGNTRADAGQIEQVLINLAINARDAMPFGGRITIETSNVTLSEEYTLSHSGVQAGNFVMVAMSDTGHGMDLETQTHLFEPFFTTKERGEGTGLGLSTVYGIVKQSGGNIWVYSEPDRGSTFKVYLPRIEERTESVDDEHDLSSMMSGDETILVVEDEATVRDLVRRVLEGHGYHILTARNASEALSLAEPILGTIDMIITDVVMPGSISGRDLADKLTDRKPALRILYISGYTGNVIVHHGILDPGVSFLQKPFTPSALALKVRQVLDTAVR